GEIQTRLQGYIADTHLPKYSGSQIQFPYREGIQPLKARPRIIVVRRDKGRTQIDKDVSGSFGVYITLLISHIQRRVQTLSSGISSRPPLIRIQQIVLIIQGIV